MMDLIESLAKMSEAKEQPGDYRQDGLLYCGHCKTPKQCRINLCGTIRIVGCQCACASREYESRKKAERERELRVIAKGLRVQGIADKAVRDYTFANADDTPEIQKCRKYVKNWERAYRENAGLLFWGGTGTGKTFAAACIANALIDQGVPSMMTSFTRILSAGWDKNEIVDQLRYFPLLVIDDLGAERQSDYAMETVHMVIDERYKSGMPLIVTTNLTLENDLCKPRDVKYQRIYDRVLEMCTPVCFRRSSIRRENAKAKLKIAEEIFK